MRCPSLKTFACLGLWGLALCGLRLVWSCKLRPFPSTSEHISKASFIDASQGQEAGFSVIGDSLSSGVLASVPLGSPLPLDLTRRLSWFLLGNAHALEQTQGEFSELGLSATATDQAWGLRAAVAQKLGTSLDHMPLYLPAQWGGRLMHVPGYLKHLDMQYQRSSKGPAAFVVFLIGGNDFCRGVSPEDFAQTYEEHLLSILKLHPKSTVLTSLLPTFPHILKFNYSYNPLLSCEQFRRSYCEPIFQGRADTVVWAYNEAITHIVGKFQGVYEGSLLLAQGLASAHLEAGDLCVDCFHLSLQGQKKFAHYLIHALADWHPVHR